MQFEPDGVDRIEPGGVDPCRVVDGLTDGAHQPRCIPTEPSPEPGERVEDWYHLVDQRKEGLQLDQPVLPTHYGRQEPAVDRQERFVGRGGIRPIRSDEVGGEQGVQFGLAGGVNE